MLSQPFGGLFVSGGSTSQAITTTPAQLTAWSGAKGGISQGANYDGDPAIVPDPANNRIKVNTPALFEAKLNISGFGSAAADLLFQIRVNGAVQADLSHEICAAFNTYSLTASLSPVAVAANTTAEQTLAFAGVLTTDTPISILKPTAQAGLGIVGVRIPSAGNVAITFSNNTAAPITPTASETYTFNVARAARTNGSFVGNLNIARPSSGNLSTLGTPTGPFDGGSGGPLTETVVDVVVSVLSGAGISFTVEYANLQLTRLG